MVSIWAVSLLLASSPGSDAAAVVDHAIQNMGGFDKLVRVAGAHEQGISQYTLPEESDKWEGPYFTNYLDFDQTLDYAHSKVDRRDKTKGVQFLEWSPMSVVRTFNAGRASMTGNNFICSALEQREELGLNPCRALLFAKRSKDLTLLPPATDGAESFDRLRFKLLDQTVTVWLQRPFGKVDRIEELGPRDGFWAYWGDVRSVTSYGNWQPAKPGVWWPMNWTVTRNGLLCIQTSLTYVELAEYAGRDAASLGEELLNITPQPPTLQQIPMHWVEIAPEVLQLAGGFTAQVVVGPKGLIVFDAPNTSAYGDAMIEDLAKRYPGKPIRAVVLTDLYWPHFGAVRSFVARGIPVYVAPGNEPLVRAMVAAPHKSRPDALEIRPAPLKLKTITEPVFLESAGVRVVVAPLQGWTSSRMLAAYVPGSKTLFCSDTIVFETPTKLFSDGAALDVVDLVRRMKWEVATVFAQHAGATPWSKVLAVLGIPGP